MNKRIEATIHGRVQNVAFRHYTSNQARLLGVRGWVANRPDGTVRVVAEGDERILARFSAWLHEGPSAARVDFVDLIWLDATGDFSDFTVRG
jgi:acylphosphatase